MVATVLKSRIIFLDLDETLEVSRLITSQTRKLRPKEVIRQAQDLVTELGVGHNSLEF